MSKFEEVFKTALPSLSYPTIKFILDSANLLVYFIASLLRSADCSKGLLYVPKRFNLETISGLEVSFILLSNLCKLL